MAEIVDFKALAAPFEPADIEWRVQRSGVNDQKQWAMVLAYLTNRAIQQRLDDVCSPENWRNEYMPAPDNGVLCGISIRIGDEWVTKYDGAENTNIEAVKGGLSDAMKRAAVQWGMGRYLYKLEATFVTVTEEKGDNYIKDDKNNVKGYWNAPKLPSWAMPETLQKRNAKQAEQFATDADALEAKKEELRELMHRKYIAPPAIRIALAKLTTEAEVDDAIVKMKEALK